jgi:hypothetical protein
LRAGSEMGSDRSAPGGLIARDSKPESVARHRFGAAELYCRARLQFDLLKRSFLDPWRSARECGFAMRRRWQALRGSAEYLAAFDDPAPLVSICIATFNRGALLAERSVRAALAQTYPNVEVIVVGDACTDDTAERMTAVADPRLRFVNLPERGRYPDNPLHRWMVAGTVPMNVAMRMARGRFVTHLDDDDEHAPDRVQTLLDFVREGRLDLAWHPFDYELTDGSWRTNAARRFVAGHVTTSSIFYHAAWRAIEWNIEAWRTREPGDWNRLRRIRFLGARAARHPKVMLKHYRERSQRRT